MSAACQYETDVTDAQWEVLYPLLPKPTWTPPAFAAAGGQWHFVCQQDGLPVAHAAQRIWTVGDGLWLLSALAPAAVWERVMTELRQLERRCRGRLASLSAGAI